MNTKGLRWVVFDSIWSERYLCFAQCHNRAQVQGFSGGQTVVHQGLVLRLVVGVD